MMTAIICRKNFQWGHILYQKIKESQKTPKFGRIISLYLHQLYPDSFDISKGSPIHHLKKVSITSIHRWEIKLTRPGSAPTAPSIIHDEDDRIPSPLPSQAAGTSSAVVEGEPASSLPADQQNASSAKSDSSDHQEAQNEQDISSPATPEKSPQCTSPQGGDTLKLDILIDTLQSNLEESHADQDLQEHIHSPPSPPADPSSQKTSSPLHSELPKSPQQATTPETAEDPAPAEGEHIDLTSDSDHIEAAEPRLPSTSFSLPTYIDEEGDQLTYKQSHSQPSSVLLEEITPWKENLQPPASTAQTLPPPEITNFSQLASLLQSQRTHFDKSIEEVHKRISSVEKEMQRGFAEIQDNTDQFKTLFRQGGKALDHTITSIGEVMNQSVTLAFNQIHLHTKTEEYNLKLSAEINTLKEEALKQVTSEVSKGEDKVKLALDVKIKEITDMLTTQIAGFTKNIHQQIGEVNKYTYDTGAWLHNEIFPDFKLQESLAGPYNQPIPKPTFSPRPDSYEGPPSTYDQVWDQPELPPINVKVPDNRKRKYGEGVSARKSNPDVAAGSSSKQVIYEVWSPTSRSIILSTLELTVKHGEKVDQFYNQAEWDKYQKSLVKIRLHNNAHRGNPNAPPAPPKYFPKPFAYFERQAKKAQNQDL